MKKLIAIFLVCLLLFNALGFVGLFMGLHYKTSQDLVQRLDNRDYSDSETVTLKVPMAIPYHIDSEEFERVDGEIEHQGEFYRLVKQKLVKDTLYIVCIKDMASKRLKQALADYVKTFTDKPSNSNHQSINITSTFIKDYIAQSFSVEFSSAGWTQEVAVSSRPVVLLSSFSASIVHPPERG
ncbi:MAG: hypothetical protein ABI663_12450 [Chryseolinea sp.]